jgi:anti-anti-sigma regulatory factor
MSSKPTGRRTKTARAVSVKLKPTLGIAQARTFQARLNKALGAGRAVVLDASEVERTDAAGLQLLCAFFRSSRATGIDVRWKAPAGPLCADAAVLGLSGLLELPAAGKG